jgi:hypothetical protein
VIEQIEIKYEKESGLYTARCLNTNIVGDAPTEKEAVRCLKRLLVAKERRDRQGK